MSIRDEILRLAQRFDGLFRGRQVPFAFMGGVAVNVWAVPAATYDLDLCADLDPEHVRGIVGELDALGFVPPPSTWLDAIGKQRFRKFTVQWPFEARLMDVDVFLSAEPFTRSALGRRRTVELEPGFRTEVVGPEDLLVFKLVAYRPKDRGAIDRLLAVQRDLDWTYVKRWADRFDILDRYREALREAGIPEPPA